ncbi:ferredoxin reductase [Streptomyces albidoflavus]|uniref:ferredoxin reductase n=1 Tax=Streptomyces albidoflavus TaxID=1886 RepID=UPI002251AFA6|nr:ferredoxin reductase [Streptomyces albidoflavus]MCX4438620.1 ferredoxin reductase [Streptomyces albidoflavus]WTB79373.1 ferredoxin reductase [Streptomyces albidoflavus]
MTSAALGSRAWKLLEMVTTPLLPSDYLDLVSPLRAGADLRGRIEAVRPETRDAATVVIRPGRGWRGHTAGQYVRIGVDVDGVRLWRAYSITSPTDRQDGCVTITVKAILDGKVSNHLVRRAKPGTLIQLDQATGDFVLPQAKPAKVLFLTAGSGITPVMGMLRDTAFDDAVMIHCAPQPQDVIFRSELHGLAAAGKLRLIEVHTATDSMLDIARLDELVPDWAERETWACGPTGLLDAADEHWSRHGVQERLHTERFRPGTVVAGDGGEVTFSATGKTVDADGATPLLDIGEEAGVLMPSGCRMGICFGCVTPLRAGSVRDLRTGEITAAEPGVLIQTCVSAAAGPCDIER